MNDQTDQIVLTARTTIQNAMSSCVACALMAIGAGMDIHPNAAYTVGTAAAGVGGLALMLLHWRTRRAFWKYAAFLTVVLIVTVVRDSFFPGRGFLRGMFGYATAATTGLILLRVFRQQVYELCRLDS